MCSRCGDCYGQMKSFQNEQLQVYKFSAGLCKNCSSHGNRHLVPGFLDQNPMLMASYPPEILTYQIEVELAFLFHPQHPHNKDNPQ